jgi:hypothetical protein
MLKSTLIWLTDELPAVLKHAQQAVKAETISASADTTAYS